MPATPVTDVERDALRGLLDLQEQARGDHPILADMRRQIAERTDEYLGRLEGFGVDTAALLAELDPDGEEPA